MEARRFPPLTKFQRVAGCDELEDGKPFVVRFGREEVCVLRWDGQFLAFANNCPHMDAPMQWGYIEAGFIECPWHGYRYDLRSGRRIRVPGATPLVVYPVRISDGDVYVGPAPPVPPRRPNDEVYF